MAQNLLAVYSGSTNIAVVTMALHALYGVGIDVAEVHLCR